MDFTSIGGIVFAIVCILGGQALEGGHASSLGQATAFIIVVGGTIGAVAVAFPMPDFLKGVKMAGRMGGARFTVQNLTIQAIDAENNLILVKGAVPGPKGALVLVRSSAKASTRKGGAKK